MIPTCGVDVLKNKCKTLVTLVQPINDKHIVSKIYGDPGTPGRFQKQKGALKITEVIALFFSKSLVGLPHESNPALMTNRMDISS